MPIEIVDASCAQSVVRNLFALYAHDLSDLVGLDIDEDGTFALPPRLATYWQGDLRHHPFLVRADGKLAGFALVRQLEVEAVTHDMAEFFILRKFRRARIGQQAAWSLFDRFPGNWEVRELIANTPAQAFWRRIIGDYTCGDFDERTEFFEAYKREFVVQRFRSR
jgi:predicted acetyltransferase